MVSASQHIAASATDDRHGPGAARSAAESDSPLLATAARIAAPVMWNMRKIHFSHRCKTAAARTAVKGARYLPVAQAGEAP
jgi:hypothetical protein